jgi:hypothetical protein
MLGLPVIDLPVIGLLGHCWGLRTVRMWAGS